MFVAFTDVLYLPSPSPVLLLINDSFQKSRVLLPKGLGTIPSMSHEPRMFTQSDMHPSNFGVDENGQTVLMDFREIGVVTKSFVAYTLWLPKYEHIARLLDVGKPLSCRLMGRLSTILRMTSG